MKSLLIVDDQLIYLKSLEVALRGQYKITTASDFDHAVNQLNEGSIDVTLIDIRLDENDTNNKDGLKLLELIKRLHTETKVFMMSAYQEFSYAEQALNLGAAYFFRKPIDILNLIKIIGEKS